MFFFFFFTKNNCPASAHMGGLRGILFFYSDFFLQIFNHPTPRLIPFRCPFSHVLGLILPSGFGPCSVTLLQMGWAPPGPPLSYTRPGSVSLRVALVLLGGSNCCHFFILLFFPRCPVALIVENSIKQNKGK